MTPEIRRKADDRRRLPRFNVIDAAALSGFGQGDLVDLSRSGMAIEVKIEDEEPMMGDCHFFQLHCAGEMVELTGRVRWVLPSADATPDEPYRVVRVGLSFTEILSPEKRGIWSGLEVEH